MPETIFEPGPVPRRISWAARAALGVGGVAGFRNMLTTAGLCWLTMDFCAFFLVLVHGWGSLKVSDYGVLALGCAFFAVMPLTLLSVCEFYRRRTVWLLRYGTAVQATPKLAVKTPFGVGLPAAFQSVWSLNLTYPLPSGKTKNRTVMTPIPPTRHAEEIWWVFYDPQHPERAVFLNEILEVLQPAADGGFDVRKEALFWKLSPLLMIAGGCLWFIFA